MSDTVVGYATLQVIPSMKGIQGKLQAEVDGEVTPTGEKAGKGWSKSFVGGVVGGFAAGALATITSKITGFATGAVDAFSRVEDATGAAGVVFGKNVADISKWAASASTNFGLAQGAALDAALEFGTFGKAAGLSGKDLAGFATEMGGLAGDLASFRGTSTEQAVLAIGAAMRGEMEPIRAYGVLLDDATLRDEALRMGLIKTTKQALTPQQKTLAAQSAILKQTKDAQGDYARTADSTANVQKTLAAQTENAQAALGKKLAPALTWVRLQALTAITGFSGFLDVVISLGGKVQELAGFVQDNGTVFSVVAGIIAVLFLPHLIALGVQSTIAGAKSAAAWVVAQASAVRAAAVHSLSILKMIAQWVLLGVTSTAQAAVMAAAWVAGVIRQAVVAVASMAVSAASIVAGWVLMGVQSMLQAARMAAAWFIALGPIGWAIAAIIAVVAIVIANWDKIVAWTKKAWTAVVDWISQAWEKVKGWVMAGVTFVVNLIKAYFNLYVSIIRGALNAAGAVVQFVWNLIRGYFDFYLGLIRAVVSGGISFVKNAIEGLKSIPGRVRSFFGSAHEAVVDKVGDVISTVKGLPGRVLSALGNLGSKLYNAGRELIQGLIDGITSKIKAVTNAVSGIASKIKGFFPGSPVKEGPLVSWNNGGAGKRLGGLLVAGLDASGKDVLGASNRLAGQVASARAPRMTSSAAIGSALGAGAAGGGDTYGDIRVELAVKDLEELQTVQDFLDLIQRKRVDQRREDSGKVVA